MEYAIGIIIIIVIIQFALHTIFYRSTTKELKELRQKLPKESAARREERILKLYANIEELMEAFEEYVDETRAELSRFRKEAAYRTSALPRVREKTAEVRDAVKAEPDFRSQMRLPLPGAEFPEDGVVLELNRAPEKEKSAEPQAAVPSNSAPQKTQPTASPAPEFSQKEPEVKLPSFEEFGESLDAFLPPTAKNLGKTTVIRPLPPEEYSDNITDTDLQASKRFATKPQKIRFLSSRGYHPDVIARELSIGKGEVEVVLRIDDTP